jgi:hypothetical protein
VCVRPGEGAARGPDDEARVAGAGRRGVVRERTCGQALVGVPLFSLSFLQKIE